MNAPTTTALCLVPDYLIFNVRGAPKQDLLQRLEHAQQAIRESGNKSQYIEVPQCPEGGVYLFWQWQGGYSVRFVNDVLYGEFTKLGQLPTFRLRIQSRVLNTGDWDLIEQTVEEAVDCFMEHTRSVQVSRVDLAVDFQSDGFELPDLRDAVKLSRRNGFDEDTKMGHEGLIFGKRRKEGSTPAKNPKMQAILYNKTSAIRHWEQKRSAKYWMCDVHQKAEGYREDLPVYRLEFRYFREVLREMKPEGSTDRGTGIETLADLRSSLGDLTRAAVGGDGRRPWLRFCDPETRGRDSRPPARWWWVVAEAFKKNLTVSGRFRNSKPGVPNMTHARASLLAYNAKIEAEARMHDPSHKTALVDFPPLHRRAMELELRARSTTWEEEVEKQAGRLTDSVADAELYEGVDKVA